MKARTRIASLTVVAATILAPLMASPAQAADSVPCGQKIAVVNQRQADVTAANLAVRAARGGASTEAKALVLAIADLKAARSSLNACLATAAAATVTATNFRLDPGTANSWDPSGRPLVVADLTFTGLAPNTTYLLNPAGYCQGGAACSEPFTTDADGVFRTTDVPVYATYGWAIAYCDSLTNSTENLYDSSGDLIKSAFIAVPDGICGP